MSEKKEEQEQINRSIELPKIATISLIVPSKSTFNSGATFNIDNPSLTFITNHQR